MHLLTGLDICYNANIVKLIADYPGVHKNSKWPTKVTIVFIIYLGVIRRKQLMIDDEF